MGSTLPVNDRFFIRIIIANILILAVWVSFRPFETQLQNSAGGDIVNQVGFGLLLVLCLATFATLIKRQLLSYMLTPSYLMMAVVLLFSIVASTNPGASFRAMIFSVVVIMSALTVMTLPRNTSQLAVIIGTGCLLALLFSYVAIIFYPESAVHPFGGNEPQHAGLWRGIYDHKNVASAVMAVFALIGVFVYREKHRLLGLSIIILALIFLSNSGSKTSVALLPVSFFYTLFLGRLKTPSLRFVFALIPLGILFTITAGSAVFDTINGVLQWIAPGTTFTGRLDLWQYTVERIGERPFSGFGFENFWGTPIVTNADQPIELSWDVRNIVHGHNSYIDATIAFGLPGLAVVMYVLVIRPAADYAATNWQGSSARLANFLISVWIFATLNACLESFFFRRADPVWFGMLLAVLGLRLLAMGQSKRSAAPPVQSVSRL